MEKVINLSIPNVGEQIFAHLRTKQLVEYMKVSSTWKVLALNALIRRHKRNPSTWSYGILKGFKEVLAQNALFRSYKGKPSICDVKIYDDVFYDIQKVVKILLDTTNDIENDFNDDDFMKSILMNKIKNSMINDYAKVFKKVVQTVLMDFDAFEELNDVNQSWADIVELMLKYSLDHGIGNVLTL